MQAPRCILAAAGAVLALVAPACLPPSPAERSIEAANQRMIAAVRHADASAFAAEYLDDARMLPPDEPELVGREAIRASIASFLEQGLGDLTLQTHEVVTRGELACERGSFTMTMAPQGGPRTVRAGKYVVVWRRGSDLSWRISIDIFNFDAPPPAAAVTGPSPAVAPADGVAAAEAGPAPVPPAVAATPVSAAADGGATPSPAAAPRPAPAPTPTPTPKSTTKPTPKPSSAPGPKPKPTRGARPGTHAP
jgi:uncharacterized protein (TIGR02246 family)